MSILVQIGDWESNKSPGYLAFLYHEEHSSKEIISKYAFPETLEPKYEGSF